MENGLVSKFQEFAGLSTGMASMLLTGRRNASRRTAVRIVSALGGNPADLNQLDVWREGGSVVSRRKAVENWSQPTEGR